MHSPSTQNLVWVSTLLFFFSDIWSDNIFFWVSAEKRELNPSQLLYHKLEKYLSLSIYKNIYLIHKASFFHMKIIAILSTKESDYYYIWWDQQLKKKRLHNLTWMHTRLCMFYSTLSGLKQFLATESPLKVMKKSFLFHLQSSFHSQDI